MRALAAIVLLGCGSSPVSNAPDAAAEATADAAPAMTSDAPTDKASPCASTFGNVLTNAFGRVDGTILAIVPPTNTTCALANSTHVVVEVTMQGAAYRMVVNVLSTTNDPHVFLGEVDAPLAGGPWQEGWHPGSQLDYVTTLHVTKSAFTSATEDQAVTRVTDALELGAKISVFATSSGGIADDSAHLVHRNHTNADGAIVLHPDTAPHYLLTAFPEQTF